MTVMYAVCKIAVPCMCVVSKKTVMHVVCAGQEEVNVAALRLEIPKIGGESFQDVPLLP